MQFIVIFLLSFSVFAKSDYCSFSSEFAEKYMDARLTYAQVIKDRRHNNPFAKNTSGKFRAKQSSEKWVEASLKKTVNKLFKTSDIEIKVKSNGKMLIYPKKVREGNPIIVFDPSGDYFRIAKAKTTRGMVIDEPIYFDLNGRPLVEPSTKNRELFDRFASQTHFQAVP